MALTAAVGFRDRAQERIPAWSRSRSGILFPAAWSGSRSRHRIHRPIGRRSARSRSRNSAMPYSLDADGGHQRVRTQRLDQRPDRSSVSVRVLDGIVADAIDKVEDVAARWDGSASVQQRDRSALPRVASVADARSTRELSRTTSGPAAEPVEAMASLKPGSHMTPLPRPDRAADDARRAWSSAARRNPRRPSCQRMPTAGQCMSRSPTCVPSSVMRRGGGMSSRLRSSPRNSHERSISASRSPRGPTSIV